MNRYATELIGTFFLVFAIGMTAVLSTFVYAERPDFSDDPFFLDGAAPTDLTALASGSPGIGFARP